MSNYIASIDVGTTNIKINLFDSDYQVIDVVKTSHLKIHHTDERFEMDLEEIWGNIVTGLKGLIQEHSLNKLEVVLTTAMHSVQLMNPDYSLKGGLIVWADKRGATAIERLDEQELAAQYYRTGTPIHSMNPYFKLLALKKEIEANQLIGSLKDIIFYRLTGEWAIDISNASSSGLLNLENMNWDAQSLNKVGISNKQLPQIKATSYIRNASVALFNLEMTVYIGTSDGVSSNYVFKDLAQTAVLSVGTSHAVRVISSNIQLNKTCQNFAYAIDETSYLIGLPSNNGADVLLWANKIFNSTFEELNQIVKKRPLTQSVFIPYLNGERAPIWNEFATSSLSDLTRVSTRESVLFAIVLGMIFNIKHNVRELSQMVEFDRIGLVGGVTELDAFPQLIADILGYKLFIPNMQNAETLGSIRVVKTDKFQSEYQVIQPAENAHYDSLFEKYLQAVEVC